MSLQDIITKQLNKYPVFKKQARIGYYEKIPLKQVHMDTMFWQVVETDYKIPILCLVDVATRFTMYFVQTKKSENIKGFLSEFIDQVKARWSVSSEMILVTDGAPEFKSIHGKINGIDVKLHLSTGINKAVLAEVGIRKARAILRKIETRMNVDNILEGSKGKIDESNIAIIFEIVQQSINQKARLRSPPETVEYQPSKFKLGDAVFALNFYKFYPHQMKSNMTKQSYKLNWYYEPFRVSKTYLINGVYKHTLAPYTNLDKDLKYYFYEDQLQLIDLRSASDYIRAYVKQAKKNPQM